MTTDTPTEGSKKRKAGRPTFKEKYPELHAQREALKEQKQKEAKVKGIETKLSKAIMSVHEAEGEAANNPYLDPELQLTPQQKVFLQSYIDASGNISEAQRRADYRVNLNKVKELLATPAATLYVSRLLQEKKNNNQLTNMEVINKARKLYDLAISEGDFKAAMQATEFLGKINGMLVERSEHMEKRFAFTSGTDKKSVTKDIKAYKSIIQKVVGNTPNAEELITKVTTPLIEQRVIDVEMRSKDNLDYTDNEDSSIEHIMARTASPDYKPDYKVKANSSEVTTTYYEDDEKN